MRVYVAHADDTEDFAERVKQRLLHAGLQIPGDDQAPISQYDAMIVIMTPAADFSDEIDHAIEAASTAGLPVLPVLRRGRPHLALAGLPFEDMADPYEVHHAALPRRNFITRLPDAAVAPLRGWLSRQQRTNVRERLAAAIADPWRWRRTVFDVQHELGGGHPTALEFRARALEANLLDDDALAGGWQRLIADQTVIFGADHDATMLSRHCLADIEINTMQGRDQAIMRFRALFPDEDRLYGDDHWRGKWTYGLLEDFDR
jgi:hypothetical protein